MGLNDLQVLHNFRPTLRGILEDLRDDATLKLLEELEETCM
ncbi:N(2)-fixation sustaining protein CowN (fragment) [Methylocella tundrae]|uniref:N(2)-fixation sustaining protein CowN n=1 Tax=Methylocella tundrae TaxID=227605 RepID=A0A4U8Z6Y5_METTU